MPADLQRARALFLHAVGNLPAERWDEYVAQACGADAELQQQVRHFLQVHREAGSFLNEPAVALGTTGDCIAAASTHASAETAGTCIGAYKLLEQIGEGGFGVVFMAEQQEPVRRKVALKVLKPGMDTRQVVLRFEAERQALALMDQSEYRPCVRRRGNRFGPAVLCHGAGQGRADHELLRRQPDAGA